MVFLGGDHGCNRIESLIQTAKEASQPLAMSVINWGEVYYIIWRQYGPEAAEREFQRIARLPIEVVDADQTTTRLAASLKVRHRLPYVDCFAAALARIRGARLVTADEDFMLLGKQFPILWLR